MTPAEKLRALLDPPQKPAGRARRGPTGGGQVTCSVCSNPLPAGIYDKDRPYFCRRRCFQVARVLTCGPEGPVYENGDSRHPIPGTGLSMSEALSMGSKWLKRWGAGAKAYKRALREGRLP